MFKKNIKYYVGIIFTFLFLFFVYNPITNYASELGLSASTPATSCLEIKITSI